MISFVFLEGQTSKTSSPVVCKARRKAKRCHQHVFTIVSKNYLHPPTCLARRTVTSFLGTCYTYISGGGDSEDCPNIERLLHQKEVSSEHNLVLEFIKARNALELVIVKNLFLIIYANCTGTPKVFIHIIEATTRHVPPFSRRLGLIKGQNLRMNVKTLEKENVRKKFSL